MKRKITVTTGSRADYGILFPVLEEIHKSKSLDLHLIVVGMHLSKKFGHTINEIKKSPFKIIKTSSSVPGDDSPFSIAESIGKQIIEFSRIFRKLKPEINLMLGDRDEMLSSAVAASHMNIPNAHIHGGDISGGLDEYNRHAITKLSNLHFTATKNSKKRILLMGENPKFVYFTGSPSLDNLKNKITSKQSFVKKYRIIPNNHTIVLIQHPVTTQTNLTKQQIQNSLKAVISSKKQVISICPNSDAGHSLIFKALNNAAREHTNFSLFTSLPREDFLCLLDNCGVLVGNSSSGLIESSYFGIPVVNIGNRQFGREKGPNVYDVPHEEDQIKKAISSALKKSRLGNSKIYGNGTASKKIVKILETIKIGEELMNKQLYYKLK